MVLPIWVEKLYYHYKFQAENIVFSPQYSFSLIKIAAFAVTYFHSL